MIRRASVRKSQLTAIIASGRCEVFLLVLEAVCPIRGYVELGIALYVLDFEQGVIHATVRVVDTPDPT